MELLIDWNYKIYNKNVSMQVDITVVKNNELDGIAIKSYVKLSTEKKKD